LNLLDMSLIAIDSNGQGGMDSAMPEEVWKKKRFAGACLTLLPLPRSTPESGGMTTASEVHEPRRGSFLPLCHDQSSLEVEG
jgi:hypothetical protein